MLIYSMSVSVDGFIDDREGAFGWTVPGERRIRRCAIPSPEPRSPNQSD